VAPAARIYCGDNPLTEKPDPLALTWPMVALAFPLFVSVIDLVTVVPTFTFPKLSLAGAAVSCA